MAFFAEFHSIPILDGRVTIPATGRWHADLRFDRIDTPWTLPLTDFLIIGDLRLLGTVISYRDFAGIREARVVGGYGGWDRALPAKQYRAISAALVLADAAASVGEQIATIPREILQDYVRQARPARQVLQELASGWWIDPAGITQTVSPSRIPITDGFEIEQIDGSNRIYHILTDSLAPWLPGATFLGVTGSGEVNRIMHRISSGSVRTEVMVT